MNNTRNKTKKINKNNINTDDNLYNLYTSMNSMNNYELNYGNNYNKINSNILNTLTIEERDKKKKYFYVITEKGYIFRAMETEYQNDIEIYFFINGKFDTKDICVKISISKNKRSKNGNIDTLYYNRNCSISKIKLESKNGTIEMLKTALQYICDKYPYVVKFKLQDETHYNSSLENKPHITAKRLLLGRPGWYQEHFGAKPGTNTMVLIKVMNKIRSNIDDAINEIKPKNTGDEWWTTPNILKLIGKFPKITIKKKNYDISHKIMGTEWYIDKKSITSYNIKYSIENVEKIDNLYSDDYYRNYVNIHVRNSE